MCLRLQRPPFEAFGANGPWRVMIPDEARSTSEHRRWLKGFASDGRDCDQRGNDLGSANAATTSGGRLPLLVRRSPSVRSSYIARSSPFALTS